MLFVIKCSLYVQKRASYPKFKVIYQYHYRWVIRVLSMICLEVPPAFKGEDSLVNFNLAVDGKIINIALDLTAIAFQDYRVAP